MMALNSLKIGAAGLMLAAATAFAQDHSAVEQRLAALLPEGTPVDILPSAIPGLVEIRSGMDVVLMTADGKHLIRGEVLDLDAGDDLIELGRRALRQPLIEALDPAGLISYGERSLPHEVLVFTDTDCGYCRRLHQQLALYQEAGIRVSYAAYPRAGLGSSTHQDLVSIWCAEDPVAAMDQAQSGVSLPPKQCQTPIEAHVELGRALNIRGTPTMVLANGETINGFLMPEPLLERLSRLPKTPASAQ